MNESFAPFTSPATERAVAAYRARGRLLGANFLPSTAVNSTEMWQAATYDEATIRREMGYAAAAGLNSLRVFLPFCVFEREGDGFLRRFEDFCRLAEASGLSLLPILFDDCAFDGGADPTYGPQLEPIPGVHNSRWTPSPGARASDDPAMRGKLRDYVTSLVGAHRSDRRIAAWDLYNEPGSPPRGEKCLPLLRDVFAWAREVEPEQPLTTGLWDKFDAAKDPVARTILTLSDVVSFHGYGPPEETERKLAALAAYGRPLLCTEWLCRERDNRVENILPLFDRYDVSAWNWGLVVGRTQTNLHWGVTDPDPTPWQHDLFYPDGTPYREEELALLAAYRQGK